MKKTIYLIAILIIGFTLNTFGDDTIVLDFTAQNKGQHVVIDSILIMNLTKDADTMLYWPDTVLILYIEDSIMPILQDQLRANSFSVSQNYPNPIVDQTYINVCIEKRDDIAIRIFDLAGRQHAAYEDILDAGKHTFTFCPGKANFYIFSVSYQGLTRSIKMASLGSAKQECKLAYMGYEQYVGNLKSFNDGGFPFDYGDTLRYIGYSETKALIRGSDFIEDNPENSESYLFDITEGIPCIDIPIVNYQFRDYKTVQIGTQCWFKENLNVGTMIPGIQPQFDNGIIEKYCFNNYTTNCDMYGGLYQWDEIMKYDTVEGIQGICPPGWHIPTDEEWKQLEGTVDSYYGYPDPIWDSAGYRGFDVGERLKATRLWMPSSTGNDYFGFAALGTGCCIPGGTFVNEVKYTSMWSSTKVTSMGSWYRFVEYWETRLSRSYNSKLMGRSVRCLKDE